MLTNLWVFLKSNFNQRFIVYVIAIFSAIFITVFNNPSMKLVWLLLFLVSGELVVILFASRLLSILELWFKYKIEPVPIPDEISSLSNRMRVHIRKFSIAHGMKNAYATPTGSVVVGSEIIKDFPKNEYLAIVAHEFGHVKSKHVILLLLAVLPITMYGAFGYRNLPSPMAHIALLAFVIICMMPIQWHFEYRADALSANYAGKENMKAALLRLSQGINPDEPSEDHPSIYERINLFEKKEG